MTGSVGGGSGGGSGGEAAGGEPISIRRAGAADAAAIADVYLSSFRSVYTFPLAHPDEDVARWIRDELIPDDATWLAETAGGTIVGFTSLGDHMLDQLYVAPGWTGRGIGGRLVELAKERLPDGFDLYTFQVNVGARRFYERHGMVVVALGDGSGNEERQPDVRYAWRPA